jgi:hypothetical protein
VNVHDSELRTVVTTADQARAILTGNLNLVIQLAENEVTERDVVALGYRRKQFGLFERMLNDPEFFVEQADLKTEAVWQAFFEANPWVFGYGLSYIFMDSLAGKELEQTVRGFSVSGAGKRVDALMKTRAEVSSLCFVGCCHTNLIPAAMFGRPAAPQAAVAARHVRNASSRKTRSVRRDVRWRWMLKVFWTAA